MNNLVEMKPRTYGMEKNPFKWPLSVLFGFIIILVEITFTIKAYSLWPIEESGAFTVFRNWHSDLGSSLSGYNSIEGAFYHNSGIIIQGFAIIMFCGGLSISLRESFQNKYLFLICQIFGILSGFALLMAGIYSLDLREDHKFWASCYFICILPFIGMLSYLLIHASGFKKWIGFYGFFVILFDGIFALTFLSPIEIYILEYFVIGSIQLFILLVAMSIFMTEVMIQALNTGIIKKDYASAISDFYNRSSPFKTAVAPNDKLNSINIEIKTSNFINASL
ncbi:MAG: hypothetical protein ACFFCQ_15995 [Promethearchaeota archaeon]